MLSYITVNGTIEGIGTDAIQALVTDDGTTITVYGDSNVADDLRDAAADITTSVPELRLGLLTHGMSMYNVRGPYTTRSDYTDGALLAKAHGLS